jgi:hypothetical protein
MMKYLLSLLMFASSLAMAGEGHHWAQLDGRSKMWVVAMYSSGEGAGCVSGIQHSTNQLFSDDQTRLAQYMKLSKICDLSYANDVNVVRDIIGAIDNAYKVAGAAEIPLGIMLMLAFENHKKGVKEIPAPDVQRWVKSLSYR